MIWPFRRKPAPPAHLGPTTVDWVPGDIAECIDDDWFIMGTAEPPSFKHPVLGTKAMVLDVESKPHGFYLGLLGFPELWNAAQFRKVVLTENGADRVVGVNRPVKADA